MRKGWKIEEKNKIKIKKSNWEMLIIYEAVSSVGKIFAQKNRVNTDSFYVHTNKDFLFIILCVRVNRKDSIHVLFCLGCAVVGLCICFKVWRDGLFVADRDTWNCSVVNDRCMKQSMLSQCHECLRIRMFQIAHLLGILHVGCFTK